MSKAFGDSFRYLTPLVISLVGWRGAWVVGGGFGIFIGVLILLTIKEPETPNATNNQAKNLLKSGKLTLPKMMKEYKRQFGLLFTNLCAVVVVMGSFARLW